MAVPITLARMHKGARRPAEATAEWNVDLGQELVRVFPEPAGPSGSLPGAVPLVVDSGVARLVAIEPGLLDGGALALEPLDQVVASPGEVAGFGEDAKAALLTWIDGWNCPLAASGCPTMASP